MSNAGYIPERDANFPRWQTIVAKVVNRLAGNPTAGSGAIGILPVVVGEPPALVSDGAGHLIYMEIFE